MQLSCREATESPSPSHPSPLPFSVDGFVWEQLELQTADARLAAWPPGNFSLTSFTQIFLFYRSDLLFKLVYPYSATHFVTHTVTNSATYLFTHSVSHSLIFNGICIWYVYRSFYVLLPFFHLSFVNYFVLWEVCHCFHLGNSLLFLISKVRTSFL